MKMAKKILSSLLAASMLLGTLTACGGGNSDTTESAAKSVTEAAASSGNTLTVGMMADSAGFDPAESQGSPIGMSLVYDTVVRMDVNGQLQPCLATDWEWTDDTTVVLTIRDGVKFSNGDPLTPEDVLYTFRHFTEGSATYAADTGYDNIDFDNCSVDGMKLTIKLKEPDVLFIDRMVSFRWSSVVSQKLGQMTEDEIWNSPVGTGPYTCVENVSGSYATFKRNEDYWGDKPAAEEITIRYYAEETTMMIDLETGAIDIAVGLSDNNAKRLENGEAKGQCKIVPSGDMILFTMPEYVDVFQDINVREAVAHALNVEQLTKISLGELGKPATSTVPETTKFYKNVGAYSYDPELSKQILADAGYQDGDINLKIVYVQSDVNDKMCEAEQSMLKEVGINLSVEGYDFATAISYFMNGDLDFSLAEFTENCFDPAILYSFGAAECTNACMALQDEEFNKLIREGKSTSDEAKRQEIYGEVQDYMYNLYRWIPVAEKMVATGLGDRINADSYYAFDATCPDLRYVTFNS